MKTILLTGSNGLLGQKLVHLIKERKDYHLIATSKGSNRITDQEGYEYSSLDITDKEEVEQIFQKHQPDIVINTAAMTNVDACESDKEGSMALNVTAVEYLIEECKKYSSHLIHLSTDFIFDGFFLQITSLGQVVQFLSDGIGGFSKLLRQAPQVAIVVGIDKKLDQ